MRTALLSAALLSILLALGCADKFAFLKPEPGTFKCVKVIDGDTLIITDDYKPMRIGLLGVAAAKKPLLWRYSKHSRLMFGPPPPSVGLDAYYYTKRTACPERFKIEFDVVKRDIRTRKLVFVVLNDGRILNKELVRRGLARVVEKDLVKYKDEMLALEAEAKRKRLGIWKNED